MSKRDEYLEKLKSKLDEWNQDLDHLEARASQVREDLKEKYHAEIALVREQRDAIKARSSELLHSSGEAWQELRSGIDAAWKDLGEAIKRARDRY